MKKNTQDKRDPRGRKTNPRGKILSNGLYEGQWNKILELSNNGGAVLLRELVDVCLDERILEELKGDTSIISVLNTIKDWYYTAKLQLEGTYAQQSEFEKLKKKKET